MASTDVGTIRLGLEANANSFQRDIQRILNDTESSVRSRGARLGAIYRRQGMSQSEAMTRAWSEVRRTVSTSCNGMTRSSQTATNRISNVFSGVAFRIASAIGVAFSVATVVNFGKTCIKTATQVENAWIGLNSIINGQGKSFDNAKKFIEEYVSDGLVPLNNAVTAYKNLSLRGYNEKQIEAVMNSLKNSATYARQSQYTLGDAITTATEGLKNENSILVDNAGVTKNVAKMWQDYANNIGVSSTSLTKQQKIQAEVNGILEESKFQMGDASRYSNSYSGQLAKLSASFTNLKTQIGNILKVIVGSFLPVINNAISVIEKLVDKVTSLLNSWGIKTDIVDTLGSISNGSESLTDSINETTKANEKLKNSLSGFDKLNVLKQEDESESSADGATTTPIQSANVNQANTELTATEKILDKITNKLKEIGSKIGFNDINWGAIKSNIDNTFADLKPIAQSAFSGAEKIARASFDTIGKAVSSTVSVVGKQLQTVTGGVSKWLDEDKTKITDSINKISGDLSSGIGNIGSFYDSIFSTLGNSIDRMRPTMETAISTLLSSFSNLGFSIGEILSSAFNIATESLANWATNNQTTIGLFFDNVQGTFAQVAEFLGGIMTDISDILTGWWYNGGAVTFSEVCRAFTDIGTTIMNVYNQWIQPAIDCMVGIFKDYWEYTLKPIFEQVISVTGKIGECIAAVWNNFLSPVVNWLVSTLAPVVKFVLNIVRGVFETVFKVIGDVISGFLKAIGGVIDFITGVFKGDWKKAWNGIFTVLDGVWQMIWGVIKGVVNLIIDGINALVGGIYSVFSTIANVVGEAAKIAGDAIGQDWGFSVPTEPPVIPKLAKGGIVKAPTLALVGDNAGANNGNPEVVAPLNKLKGMLNEGDGSAEDTVILSQILQYLIKIYEAISSDGNTNIIELIAKLDESVVFKRMIELNKQYKKRHNGKSAFA